MAEGREPAMLVASVHLGPFVSGPNTMWPGLHGFLMFIILLFAALMFGAISSTKNLDVKTVRRLNISAACSERCCRW